MAFRIAPNESLFRPSLASSLLPQLSAAARRPFTWGLVTIVVVMAALVEFYHPRAIITVAALGLPLLLMICWGRAGVFRELPRWATATVVVLSIGLAVGWVLATGDLITTMAESPFDAGTTGRRVLRDGLGIFGGGSVLMLVPAIIVRLMWRSRRNVLDGFTLGALSAVLFTAAATLTRLAPQLAVRPANWDNHVRWLLAETVVRGLTVPAAAACVGGLIGCALWLDPPAGKSRHAAVLSLAGIGLAVLGLYATAGWADAEGAPQSVVLTWHVAMAVLSVIGLRLGLQLALPEGYRQVPAAPAPSGSTWRVTVVWLAAMTACTGLFAGVPSLTVKPPPRFNCPPDCGSPPKGVPVSINPRFTAADGSFSVAYPAAGTAYDIRIDGGGVTATFIRGDGGKMRLTSQPANGRTPKDVARAFVTATYPSARAAFELPNAMVGFVPGYGEVLDVFPPEFGAGGTRMRLVVVVAVKNDLALIAGAVGPFHEFGPTFGPGRPSPTNVQIAEDMGRYVNSFRWRGDPLG
ncbi:MAG: zinc ribbon domain-containing protein [Mycobacterium sp.]